MSPLVRLPVSAVIILVAVLLSTGLLLYGLLKIHSRVMNRMGPMYAGRFHGIGQPIAEFLKPIQKEDIVPAAADAPVFRLAPLVALLPAFLIFAVIPVAPGIVAAELDLGLFYVLAISAIGAIAIVMAAYASQSKFTLIGGLRAVGQIIAYELPVVLGAVAIAMLAGSLSLSDIVEAQHSVPFVLWPLPFGAIAFGMFLIASFAEVMWNPFDMPAAESEIITGPLTEYSGMRFIFFYMSEFAHVVALSALGTLLFLGGWNGPILPPIFWFLGKTMAFGVFFIWVRFTLPRLREDQLQQLAWKLLIPLGLINVLGISVYKVLT
ncbi:MAG TPA: complex I subunit 1 family protein [Actinomycetota bacterium]|nr:complex I subunit 1 family protein [Actinomycetota bacterium]